LPCPCSETAKLRAELRKADEKSKKLEYQLERGRRLTEEVDAGAEDLVKKVVSGGRTLRTGCWQLPMGAAQQGSGLKPDQGTRSGM
jgi:hypothetical protein